MASRLADLYVQAAAEKILDFSQAKLRGNRWWRKRNRMIDYLDRKNHREHLQMLREQQLAYIASGRLNGQAFETASRMLNSLTETIWESYYPSDTEESQNRRNLASAQSKATAGKHDWESEYGSLDDPKIQEQIRQITQGLEALSVRTATQIAGQPANFPSALHR